LSRMKEVIAIIRMNAIQRTKRALADVGFPSVTVEGVFGRGGIDISMFVLPGSLQHDYRH